MLRVYLMNIYISSVGRPFVRLIMGGTGNSERKHVERMARAISVPLPLQTNLRRKRQIASMSKGARLSSIENFRAVHVGLLSIGMVQAARPPLSTEDRLARISCSSPAVRVSSMSPRSRLAP
jgi:hypothetical protein